MRKLHHLLPIAVLLALGGCDETPAPPPPPPAPLPMARLAAGDPAERANLAYTHRLELQMPKAEVAPRFERARSLCDSDAGLHCVLQTAQLSRPTRNGVLPTATLSVRLPHELVDKYKDQVLAALPGDAGPALVASQSTQMEDLTRSVEDVAQRRRELTDYRDRLLDLAKRADAKVDDLIKVASETAAVETRLAQNIAEQQKLAERTQTELLTISMASLPDVASAVSPIGQVWAQAGTILGANLAAMLRVLIGALPWLPVAGVALGLLRLCVRVMRR